MVNPETFGKCERVLQWWREFVGDFTQDIRTTILALARAELAEQECVWRTRETIMDPSTLAVFREESDEQEFFWMAAESLECAMELREHARDYTKKLDAFVHDRVRRRIEQDWPEFDPTLDNIDWAPKAFWWRHLW